MESPEVIVIVLYLSAIEYHDSGGWFNSYNSRFQIKSNLCFYFLNNTERHKVYKTLCYVLLEK